MISPRVTMVLIVGSCWLGGCAGTGSGDGLGVYNQANSVAATVPDAPAEVREQHYPDGSVSVRIEGRLDSEGNFIPHGRTTNYWNNGQKKSVVNYLHGMKHGPRTAWYENGQIWSQGNHVNGSEDGEWTVWYRDGRKERELHFKEGALHGMYTEWHSNGRMKVRVEWVMGKRQGTMTHWDENGVVVKKTDYVDGVAQP